MVLVLGERYGVVPHGSTISATHQEYREARGTKPVIAFVQEGVTAEPEQVAFIDEVQAWEGGLFRGAFSTPDELHDGVIRALHDFTLTNAVGPIDEQEMIARATALLPPEHRNHAASAFLDLAVAGGPLQRILRPAELEAATLAEHIQQSALFGEHRLMDRTRGSETGLVESDLVVRQDDGLLRFLGRKDRMVKTRGHRVELDEVEAALCSHPAVSEAAAYAVPDGRGSKVILSTVTTHGGRPEGAADILRHARGRLPGYAVPQDLVVASDLTRTTSGKIDPRDFRLSS